MRQRISPAEGGKRAENKKLDASFSILFHFLHPNRRFIFSSII
jgi:hypothetical protein